MIMLPGDCGLAAGAAGDGAVSTVCGRSATRSSTGCKLSDETSHFLPVRGRTHVSSLSARGLRVLTGGCGDEKLTEMLIKLLVSNSCWPVKVWRY